MRGGGEVGGNKAGGGNGQGNMGNEVDWELLPELLDGGQGKDNTNSNIITEQAEHTEGILPREGGMIWRRVHQAGRVRRWGGATSDGMGVGNVEGGSTATCRVEWTRATKTTVIGLHCDGTDKGGSTTPSS